MSKLLTTLLLFAVLFSPNSPAGRSKLESAIFAGGCFWCMESDFEKLTGVTEVISGYSGGWLVNPSYEQVARGGSGHLEVVKVIFDPEIIDYRQLLAYYWRHIDPTRDDGQFCDAGAQYRPAIFYQGAHQKRFAEASLTEIERTKPFPAEIRVEVQAAAAFYPAEAYHQDYSKKHPIRYRFYRYLCGRDARVGELWRRS